jgi:hypothetical protein
VQNKVGSGGWFRIHRPSEEKIVEMATLYAVALAQFKEEVCFFLFIPTTLA